MPSHARDKLTGKLAQDEYTDTLYGWAGGEAGVHAWIEEGLAFLGYPILSEMAQRAEYRIFSEVIAEDMTRRWVDLKGAGNKAKDEKVKRFADAVTKYELPHIFRTVAEYDGWFGRGHIYPDLKTPSGKWVYDDEEELKTPIGNGRDITSRTKVTKDSLKGFRVLEATWTYPGYYNSTDPLRPDWYRPENWYVMSRTVHHSRLLTIIGRPVPDILKPAYAFGGLSMSQMAKPYVDNWLQTRQSVNQIVHSFSIFGLKTNLMALLASGGHRLSERAETLCSLRDNTNLAVIDKETEDIFNISAPLGGLHELQSQAQEHMFSVARIPGVKFAGIQPSGLNACLVGDTLIETDAGYITIKDVRPGHKVMTRSGFAPVAKAGYTGYTAELVEIVSGKATLRCTANHPIWLPLINAFVPAGSVRPGNLLLCRGATESQNTDYRLHTEAASGGTGAMVTTLPRHLTTYPICSTGKFGGFITDLFQKAITFITSTKIGGTTNSRIFSSFRQRIMRDCTIFLSRLLFAPLRTLNVPAVTAGNISSYFNIHDFYFAATGAAAQTDEKIGSRGPSHRRYAFASFVGSLLRQKGKTPNIAPGNARLQAKTEPPIAKPITENIPKNGGYLRNRESVGTHCVVSSVRRVPASEYVYDIQVAPGHLPEFFANGICVHNSSEGEIRVYYDTIKGRQERMFRKPLMTCLDWIQLSEFGEIDEELTFDFVDLWQLDEAAQAAVQAQKAATHAIYVNDIAAVSPEEVRQAVAADPAGPYGGLDIGDTPPPQPDPMEAMMGGEGGQGGKPKAPLTNPLSERLERQGEEFGSPETGGFSAKDDEEADDLLPVDAYFLARG